MKKISFVIFFLVFAFVINAQKIGLPIVTNYSPNEYHGHFQTWDVVQGKSGLMYFANGDGLMVFDGVNWDFYELPDQQIPRAIAISQSGKLFIGGDNTLGYYETDSVYNLKFVSITDLIPTEFSDYNIIWDIYIKNNIVYARSTKYIFIYEDQNIKAYKIENSSSSVAVDKNENVFLAYRNILYAIIQDSITEIDFDKNIYTFLEKNDSIFFYTSDDNIYYLNEKFEPIFYKKINFNITDVSRSGLIFYNDTSIIFNTFDKGIFLFNLKSELLLNLSQETGLIGDNVYKSYVDNMNNIWVLTNAGISYIELFSPIRIVDSRMKIDISHPSFLSFFNESIYTSTGHKLYELKINHDKTIVSNEIQEDLTQTWGGVKIGDEFYISSNPRIIRIDENGNRKIYGPHENIWSINKVPFSENDYLLGSSVGIFHYKYNGDSLKFEKKIKGHDLNSRNFYFDANNNLWVSHNKDGIYKIKFTDSLTIETKEFYGQEKGLFNTNSIMFFEWKNQLLISTFKTLYVYDEKNDSICEFHQITDYFEIKDKRVLQLISIDSTGDFWFEYYNDNFDSEIFCFREIDGKFVEVNIAAKRLLNFGFIFTSDFSAENIILATSKGYVFYDKKNEYKYNQPFKALIRKVYFSSTDSLLFGGYIFDADSGYLNNFNDKHKFVVDYKFNNLRFNYAAPFYIYSEKILYRVKLENHDENWSLWTFETKKEYTNLSPGKYTFLVEAKNIYNQVSQTGRFTFYIKHPWYQTFWAYIGYFALFLFFMYLLVKFFTFRLKRHNEKLEELVEQRTIEIKQKNIELEQQKEEILTQAEELIIVNQELEKLSTIVRETDNAVILADKDGNFIWVNQAFTKIFGYTFEELVNNVSPNLIADRTEERVKDIVNKCLVDKVTVDYELEVKNKEGKEIWVHTTLTPLIDDEGEINSLVAIDSDVTQQKKYEKQILEQRDQITSSIKYALNIQQSILPSVDEIGVLFENFIVFKPKDIVSGDFYWMSNVFITENNRYHRDPNVQNGFKVGQTVFFSVVDCTGHGVPGAFMSLIGSRLLGEIVNEMRIVKPKDILYHLDFRLSRVLKRTQKRNYDGMVVSICRLDKVLKGDVEEINVTYAGAKQHITYYKFNSKEFKKLRGSARQIGFVVNESIEFSDMEFVLNKGDILFMYSDGLKDLNNPDRVSFSYKKIINVLMANINKNMNEIGKEIETELNNWLADDHQRDDITFMGLRM